MDGRARLSRRCCRWSNGCLKGKFFPLLKGQDSLSGRQGEPFSALLGGENDDSLIGREWVAVRIGLAPSTRLGCGGDAMTPGTRVTLKYPFDFYPVSRGPVTVKAGFTVLAHRPTDQHDAGLVVLVLRGFKPDPVDARLSATARNDAAAGSKYNHQEPCLRQRCIFPHAMKLRAVEKAHY
jgi:hypothetical protein